MKQGGLITLRWVSEDLINVGTGLAVAVTDNYCFVQQIKIKIKSTHRNSSSSIPMRGAGGGTVLMLTQVRWEFLLVLGQGNETLDYLGSLLWGEREREREKLIIWVLLLLPGPGDGTSPLITPAHTRHFTTLQIAHSSHLRLGRARDIMI